MSNKVFFKDKLLEMIDAYISSINNSTLSCVSKSLLENGKKIRPLIFLNILETRSFEFDQDVCALAISIEMLHCASLIIDDLPSMDNDEFRRGEKSVHAKYGFKKAQMIANKYILDSLRNIIKTVDSECKKLILQELKNASMGQLYDITGVNNSDNQEMSNIINLKTAPFFNIAFILAAYYTKEGYDAYLTAGNLFSSMFQICDDIEDYIKDLKKGHTMNHCILMGREKSLEMYIENRGKFIKCLQDTKIYLPYFIYLIDLLDKKLGLDL